MSADAYLPCLVCGRTLRNAWDGADNQPSEGTEFRTYGHYGSTFWDSMHGEQLVLNVCDNCLRTHKDRLGQQKRYIPLSHPYVGPVGKQWVDRPVVAYTGNPDDTEYGVEWEQMGTDLFDTAEVKAEWRPDIESIKAYVQQEEEKPR